MLCCLMARVREINNHLSPGYGDRLKSYRLDRNLTQRELGDASGVGYAYICRIESEERIPSLSALIRLGDALDVSPLWLATGQDHHCIFCGGEAFK